MKSWDEELDCVINKKSASDWQANDETEAAKNRADVTMQHNVKAANKVLNPTERVIPSPV